MDQISSTLGGRELGRWHQFAGRQEKRGKEQLVRRAAGPTAAAPGGPQSPGQGHGHILL